MAAVVFQSRALSEILFIHALLFVYVSFLWIPLVFLAYAIAKRRVSLRFFFILITIEAAAIAVAINTRPLVIT
jgi:hypothetical protein